MIQRGNYINLSATFLSFKKNILENFCQLYD